MTTTPISTTSPKPLDGRVISRAERATRAVLDRLLDEHDTSFNQWVTINLLATQGGSAEAGALVDQLSTGLIVDPTIARAALDEVIAAGLVAASIDDERELVELTPAGTTRYEQISAGIGPVVERLYADLPEADLVTARDVLETLTERARAILAA